MSTVREMIEYLIKQNPDALVVEDTPVDDGRFLELTPANRTANVGLRNGGAYTARQYVEGAGRIPVVVLTIDNEPH